MSFIDKEMIRTIGDFPHKRGAYEIESYLYGFDGKVNPGCWLFGDTVYGDMYLVNQNWGTYSTPILAYLEYVGMARVPSSVTHTEEVSTVEGYSRSFSSSVEAEVNLGAGFLGSVVGGKLTSTTTEGISNSSSRTRKVEMEGPGIFNFYQMHMGLCALCNGRRKLLRLLQVRKNQNLLQSRQRGQGGPVHSDLDCDQFDHHCRG